MKLHHTKYKKNYKTYILGCLDVPETSTQQEKIEYIFDRFESEQGFMVARVGKQKAIAEWLSGLALPIPYYYDEMVDLAVEMGSIEPNPNDRIRELVCENYWNFMANMIMSFEHIPQKETANE
tara:strand:+ start:258 stop:626 length:369 start_codon:yes stop_codon:yes gene_type:complete